MSMSMITVQLGALLRNQTAPEKLGLIEIYGDEVRIDRDVAKNKS